VRPTSSASLLALVLPLGGWLLATRPPGRALGAATLAGLVLFLPCFALTPWIDPTALATPGEPLPSPLVVPLRILVRGVGALLAGLATAAALTPSERYDALVALPMPHLARGVVLQVFHQAHTLGAESRRVAEAMALRCGVRRLPLALVVALPRVWLPRVLRRADRVADAMDLRGYGLDLPRFRAPHRRPWDLAAPLLGLSALAAQIACWLGEF